MSEAATLVARVNDLATEVASLNAAIAPLHLSGASPNDLMDQRDLAVSELADLVDARATYRDDGSVDLSVGGGTLVYGPRTVSLQKS